MCCLEELPLRPFTVFFFLFTVESVRSLILGLSLGKEGKKPKKKWRRSLELGGLVSQHNNCGGWK